MNLATLECPHCRGMVQVEISAAGQQVACPLCRGTMQVPSTEAFAAAAAPVPPPPPLWPPQPQPCQPAPSSMPPYPSARLPRGMPSVSLALMSLACPSCGSLFQVPPGTAGMQLPCPSCRQLVTIPGATAPVPPTQTSEPVESLLPPGAAEAGIVPSDVVPLPSPPRPVLVSLRSDGSDMAVRDRPKIVGEGADTIEVRRLSPEEKARRRTLRNAVLFILGLTILLAFIVYKTRW